MNLEENYRTLDLKHGASLKEARRSYHKMVKFFHSDRHQASPELMRKATEEIAGFSGPDGDPFPKSEGMTTRRGKKVPTIRSFRVRHSPFPPAEWNKTGWRPAIIEWGARPVKQADPARKAHKRK